MIGTTLPTPIYPLYQQHFGLTQLTVTLIYGVYALGTMSALIFCGAWSDQIGRRPIIFAAIAASALSGILFVIEMNITSLYIARILSGASAGFATGTATVFVIESAPVERRQTATLWATGVNSVGLGLGPVLGGCFAQYGPWPTRLVYIVHLFLLIFATIAVKKAPETVSVVANPSLRIRKLGLPKEAQRAFIPAAIAGIAGYSVLGFFAALTPAFMRSVLGVQNLALAGLMVCLLFIASALGQMTLRLFHDQRAMIVSCIILAGGSLIVASSVFLSSFIALTSGVLLAGIGQGLGFRAGLADVTLTAPATRRGEVNSLYFVVLYTALTLPIVGLGLWSDTHGIRSAGFGFSLIVAALALVALGALFVVQRKRA